MDSSHSWDISYDDNRETKHVSKGVIDYEMAGISILYDVEVLTHL